MQPTFLNWQDRCDILGASEFEIALNGETEFRDTTLDLALQARRSLHILTIDFDHAVLDNAALADAASHLARLHPLTFIHILVVDSTRATQRGHRLVELSRHLPSSVQIRKVARQYSRITESYVIADSIGIVRRPHPHEYTGSAQFCAKAIAQQKIGAFNQIWHRSHEDPSLRRLSL